MRAYCLSIHVTYACEHSGVCCTAPWPLPVERETVNGLRARGLIDGPPRSYIRRLDPPVHGASLMLARVRDGGCVFFDRNDGPHCRVHRQAGPGLLPAACRNFPRVTLRDRRGVFVTLSNYCPTAARLLLRRQPLRIVQAPETLTLSGQVEGLEATDVMPPLLRRDMLMDLDAYARWEEEGIRLLDDGGLTARSAVDTIVRATRDACAWSPGNDTLSTRIGRAFAEAREDAPRADPPGPFEPAVKAFVASHLFASWAAYQHGGVSAVVQDAERALRLLGSSHADETSFIAAARAADLQLRHQR